MMQSDTSNALAEYYSHLLPSLQQPPPLQPLTSSSLASSFSLTQQPSLQHTMSVADPFSPSWPFNPPSPAARKQSGAVFNGGAASWLESAQQLMPTVSSAGLSLAAQSQLSQQLSMGLLQRPAVPLQLSPPHPHQQTSVYQPLPQRAGVSGVSHMMQQQTPPMMSPPPLQQQLSTSGSITPQQLAQLRASQQQQQQMYNTPQRMQSMSGLPPMQHSASPTQPLHTNQTAFLQTLRPALNNGSPIRQPVAVQQQQQQSAAPVREVVDSSVELATVLLSYLSSVDLQRGLLYVNRLWRFKSLYVLQSRQVNIQVQLTHLYLGPFRAANMLELVFSLYVYRVPKNYGNSGASSIIKSPVQPVRPPQLSVPSSPASAVRTPLMSAATPSVITSPSTIARATVCTPMALSAVVKAKKLSSSNKNDTLLGSPSMLLGGSGGKHLSKKKMREAALLAESKYNSIIECGILPTSADNILSPPSAASSPTQRIFKLYSPFFTKQVEVYTALSDPAQQTLYRASSLAEKFHYATNKVGMYLSRRRLHSGGIYQATGFRSKPAGRTGLKCGGYFLTIEACKEFENHFQYGGLTEEQRNQKTEGTESNSSGAVDEGEMGDGEESEEEGEEGEEHSMQKIKMEEQPHLVAHHKPLAAVTKKLVDTDFGHSPSISTSAGGNSRKRSASDDPEDSPDSGDISSSPSSSFKRIRSDEGGMATTDSGSGSDSAGNMSSGGLGKRGISSDEDSSDRSPGPSSRTTHSQSNSHSQLLSSTASHSSSASVGSSSSSHRSAFKAPKPMRSSSFQSVSSPVTSFGSSSSQNDTGSPPSSGRDISPSSSPGSQQVPTLPASASFLPSISSSSPSPSYNTSAFPQLSRWNSFASPLMSPTGNQSLYSSPSAATNYMQLSSPPIGVSHQFNGLSLATGAASQSASSSSMAAPVMPLSHSLSAGQSLEAAFASALMQSGQAGGVGMAGPSASVGANGLLNLNNLTLQQLQLLLSGQQMHTASQSHPSSQQPINLHNQPPHPSLLNLVLMSAAGQATNGVQASQLQQPTVQPVQFG